MRVQPFSRDFLAEIPKSDLRLHLDGSLRISTLIELAKVQRVELPSYTEEGLQELIFKERITQAMPLSLQEFRNIIAAGFKGRFFAGGYKRKRVYVRQMLERFESCVARHYET